MIFAQLNGCLYLLLGSLHLRKTKILTLNSSDNGSSCKKGNSVLKRQNKYGFLDFDNICNKHHAICQGHKQNLPQNRAENLS